MSSLDKYLYAEAGVAQTKKDGSWEAQGRPKPGDVVPAEVLAYCVSIGISFEKMLKDGLIEIAPPPEKVEGSLRIKELIRTQHFTISYYDYHTQANEVHHAIQMHDKPCIIRKLLNFATFQEGYEPAYLTPFMHWCYLDMIKCGLFPSALLDTVSSLPGLKVQSASGAQAPTSCRVWCNDGCLETPVSGLHWEGFATSTINTQITGRKRWLLVHPRSRALEPAPGGTNRALLAYTEVLNPCDILTIDIEAGDSLFVPSGWWHAVQLIDVAPDGSPAVNINLDWSFESETKRPASQMPVNFFSSAMGLNGQTPRPVNTEWYAPKSSGLLPSIKECIKGPLLKLIAGTLTWLHADCDEISALRFTGQLGVSKTPRETWCAFVNAVKLRREEA